VVQHAAPLSLCGVDGAGFGDGSQLGFHVASCTDGAMIFFPATLAASRRHLKTHRHYHDMVWAFYTPALQLLAFRLQNRLESGEGTFCIYGRLCILIDDHTDRG